MTCIHDVVLGLATGINGQLYINEPQKWIEERWPIMVEEAVIVFFPVKSFITPDKKLDVPIASTCKCPRASSW